MAAVRIAVNDESIKGPVVWSLFFHGMLFATMAVSTLMSHRGDSWGSAGGDSVSVKLVGGLSGMPLPKPDVVTSSPVVDPSKGLYKAEPIPKPVKPPTDAKELPEFSKEKRPRYVTNPSKILKDDTPAPKNAVPYGRGGAPAMPYGEFKLGEDGGTSAGMGFSGPGGGDFAGRFSWYVDAIRGRVSSNWLQSTVDPSVRFAPRAVVTFDILRNGTVTNVQILRSSSNTSVDNSAVRAILSSSPVNPLPNEYSGAKVSVEFWFDFRR
jgi:TonB family protein